MKKYIQLTAGQATHIPTGISVRCSDERSQSQNKDKAKERLLLKLFHRNKEAEASAKAEKWSKHDSLVRGNPVKVFAGPV